MCTLNCDFIGGGKESFSFRDRGGGGSGTCAPARYVKSDEEMKN